MSKITYLPAPTFESQQWQDKAACKDMGTATFFHPDGGRDGTRRRRAVTAEAICANCPVLKQCRGYALVVHEPHGTWGGMTEGGRAAYWKGQEVKTT